jgi:hypothetical protein
MMIARLITVAAALAVFAGPALADPATGVLFRKNSNAPQAGAGAFFPRNTPAAASHHFGRGLDIATIDGVPVNGASKPNLFGNPRLLASPRGGGSPGSGGAPRRLK